MKKQILKWAAQIGIPKVAIARLGGQSAVACLFPYYIGAPPEKANISSYAFSIDYHIIVGAYLSRLAALIEKNFAARCACFSDIGPPIDKEVAFNAGLGFFGINSLIINPVFGSFAFIGYILCDLYLEPDGPLSQSCDGCLNCVRACPGGAIRGDKTIDSARCASAISQKKGPLSADEKATLKKTGLIWGCDICQSVCPHNIGIPQTPLDAFRENLVFNISREDLEPAAAQKLGKRAFLWRGRQPLLRNIKILEGIK